MRKDWEKSFTSTGTDLQTAWPEAGRSREVKSTGRQVHPNRLTGTWIMVTIIIITVVALLTLIIIICQALFWDEMERGTESGDGARDEDDLVGSRWGQKQPKAQVCLSVSCCCC